MKFHKSSQLLLVSAASLLAAFLVTACSQFTQTLTVDFVYVASSRAAGPNNYGQIDVFEINSESGAMRQIPAAPFPSGGRNPVAEAVSADNGSLFVVNQDDNTIVQFTIGSDGKLYQYDTVNTPGIYPLAVTTIKSNLFVVDTYQPLPTCSTAEPCTGSIAVYPLGTATSSTPAQLGTPLTNTTIGATYWPLTLPGSPSDVIVPTAVNVVASGAYIYVTAYDSSVTPSVGYVFGYWVAPSGATTGPSGTTCPPIPPNATTLPQGTLCPFNSGPFAAGTQPSAIASDSKSAYVYVTDFAKGDVLGYSISSASGSVGNLVPMTTGSGGANKFQAGDQPTAIVVDPSFPYAYVANGLDSTITAYAIGSGTLTGLGSMPVGQSTYAVGLEPVAIGIDPSTNHFLFTANYLGSNVSGFELSQTAGTLVESQGTPFNANQLPTAVVAVPHNGTGAGITQ